jgi:hypothetical protein
VRVQIRQAKEMHKVNFNMIDGLGKNKLQLCFDPGFGYFLEGMFIA